MSEVPVKVSKMMATKLSIAIDLLLSHSHLFQVLIVSAFVALLTLVSYYIYCAPHDVHQSSCSSKACV